MKSFTYYGDPHVDFEPSYICNDLLVSSQHSLQKLCVHKIGEGRKPLGDLTRFSVLADVEADFIPLLGSKDEDCSVLADALPMSVKRVSLFWDRATTFAATRKVILEMIKSKSQRLPKLEALTFKFEHYLRSDLRDKVECITNLQVLSAEVGVSLSATAYSRTD